MPRGAKAPRPALLWHGNCIQICSRTHGIHFPTGEKEEQSHARLWTHLEMLSGEGQTIASIPPHSRVSVHAAGAALARGYQPKLPAAHLHLWDHLIGTNELGIGFC